MKMVYKHYRTNKEYQIIGFCKIQEEDIWVDAYIYVEYRIPIMLQQKYVRSIAEFHEKFKPNHFEQPVNDSFSILDMIRGEQLSRILGKYKLWS